MNVSEEDFTNDKLVGFGLCQRGGVVDVGQSTVEAGQRGVKDVQGVRLLSGSFGLPARGTGPTGRRHVGLEDSCPASFKVVQYLLSFVRRRVWPAGAGGGRWRCRGFDRCGLVRLGMGPRG